MPRDGSGGYDRVTGTPYVANTTIDETIVNNEMADLGAEIANSLSKDGQTVPTGNLPMGGYKHTGVGNATARDSYAALGQVQDGGAVYAAAGGTGDVLTLTLSPAPAAYAAGQEFRFKATATNTGAATINVNSLGAKDIKRDGSSALVAGDIASGQMYTVRYDGTNFQLLNASTFVTQALTDSSTLPATTAFVKTLTATDARAGIIELLTEAEHETGTDTTRALTSAVARSKNLVLGTSQATTSGVNKDVTSIPSWVKRITINFAGVSLNGTSPILVQIGDSGGIETSGYTGACLNAGSGSVVSTTAASSGFPVVSLPDGGRNYSGRIVLEYMGSNTWAASWNLGDPTGATGAWGGAYKTLSATLDRFRLTTAGGTDAFDAGSFNYIFE